MSNRTEDPEDRYIRIQRINLHRHARYSVPDAADEICDGAGPHRPWCRVCRRIESIRGPQQERSSRAICQRTG